MIAAGMSRTSLKAGDEIVVKGKAAEGVPATLIDWITKDGKLVVGGAVRIVYDQAQLYIGLTVTDSEPSQIRASELRRDNTLGADDTFAVILDTYHDHRNAFLVANVN